MSNIKKSSVVMLGATGAVGGETLNTLLSQDLTASITLLGRRDVDAITQSNVVQYRADIFDVDSYKKYLTGHDVAICTLGVGQPSKMSKEDFIKIDKTAVIDFATACKQAGIKHFELLSSVGINKDSSNFFLKTKGELVEELKALHFDRLSIFQPSMIITPTNRYGFTQALTLAFWPVIDKLFIGSLKKYKGIAVAKLGRAIALNIVSDKKGLEYLNWKDFQDLNLM